MENRGDSGLTHQVCEQLLLDPTPENTGVERVAGKSGGSVDAGGEFCRVDPGSAADEDTGEGPKFLMGYPDSPLYIRLADCMSYWLLTG